MTWILTLPYERPPKGLHSNDRVHWRTKGRSTKEIRELRPWRRRADRPRRHPRVSWARPGVPPIKEAA